MKPRKSLLNALSSELNANRISGDKLPAKKPRVLRAVASKKVSPAKRKFVDKLSKERLEDFTKSDWLFYFQKLYKQVNNIPYFVNGGQMYCKHYAVINSLMKNYGPTDIKNMIDFLFLSNQNLFEKSSITIYHLSSGFLPTVYQNTLLWKDGRYEPKGAKRKRNQRVREWTSSSYTGDYDDEITL